MAQDHLKCHMVQALPLPYPLAQLLTAQLLMAQLPVTELPVTQLPVAQLPVPQPAP
jgi:hypothetical protein